MDSKQDRADTDAKPGEKPDVELAATGVEMTPAQLIGFLCSCVGATELPTTGRWDVRGHSLAQIAVMLDYAMQIPVGILDANGRYIFISSSTYRMLDCTADDLKPGDTLADAHVLMKRSGLLPEDDAELAQYEVRERTNAEGLLISERQVQFLDGRSMRLTRIRLANGYMVSVAENVTELVESNTLLEDSLELGLSGYWTYAFDTKRYQLSNSLKTLFTEEQVAHLHAHGPLVAVHPDERAAFSDALRGIARTGDRFDITTRHAMFPSLHFQSIGQLVRGPDGTPRSLRCFVRNVTQDIRRAEEFRRIKDQAVAANVAKSQFLANMSHEIRTPMNGVLGMAELLAGSALDDRQREFVSVITRSATSLLTVINDILDFSKIEAGALDLEFVPFSLRDIVSEVSTLLSPTAAEKGLELIVAHPSAQPHSFVGDGVRVRQIVTNLVGNAIKFTESGHVLIEVDAVPDPSGNAQITIAVSDTGIGIEADKLDTVFEKFTQADNSTTRIYGGTGLGLSISNRLAGLMGGTLVVDSTFGEGSTFTLSLPLPLDRSARPVVRNTAPLRGRRALIVDDIDINRRLLSEQLGGWGMKTTAVSDGVEALLALKTAQDPRTAEQPFDVVVLDYLMPGVNGRELAAMIHAQPAVDAPILMLSSCDRSQNASLDELTGVDRYLVKPVREQALFDAVLAMIYPDAAPDAAREAAPEAVVEATPAPSLSDTDLPSSTPERVSMTAADIVRERSEKLEILVAEDFPLNQDVVRLMLADTRYSPVMVENGAEAVTLYRASAPDRFAAVLMDVSMPVMDGYQATAGLAEVERAQGRAHVPVIALTGHALTHEREKCLEAGMDDYLTKPVKQVELIAALDRWTGHQSRIAVA